MAATRFPSFRVLDAGFWNLGIMKLENTYPPVHAHVVVPVLKINLNGSGPTKYSRMIPVPVPYDQEPNSKSGS